MSHNLVSVFFHSQKYQAFITFHHFHHECGSNLRPLFSYHQKMHEGIPQFRMVISSVAWQG
jgi:hypothetical protein